MPGIQLTDTGDLLNATLDELPDTFTDTVRDVDAPLFRIFLDQLRRSGNGTGYEKQIRIRKSNLARFVNLFEYTSSRVTDVLAKQRSTWVHFERYMVFDEREEAMNSGPERIVDIMEARLSDVYEDLIFLIEDALATVPNSASHVALRGPLYWLPSLAAGLTDPVGGFNGTTVTYAGGSTGTLIGELERSSVFNQRGRSYNGTWTTGEIDDPFLDLLRRARRRTSFNSLPGLRGDKPDNKKPNYLLMPQPLVEQCEKRANKGPDDYQNDLNRFVDPTIAGMQIVAVPTWDSLAYTPVVGVRTSKWIARVLANRWMLKKPARNADGSASIWHIPVEGSCLTQCDDPRSGGFHLHAPR